jgi:hypothetical protein
VAKDLPSPQQGIHLGGGNCHLDGDRVHLPDPALDSHCDTCAQAGPSAAAGRGWLILPS